MEQISSSDGDVQPGIIIERRKNLDISALDWMGRRKEDKTTVVPLNLIEAEQLINQAKKDTTKKVWEAKFLLRAIIRDLLNETEFSDIFFKKFDYYSKKYISFIDNLMIKGDDNNSLIFSQLNTVFQQRNIDPDTFGDMSKLKDKLYPNLEIRRTFVERVEDVLNYNLILGKYKNKVDNFLEAVSNEQIIVNEQIN